MGTIIAALIGALVGSIGGAVVAGFFASSNAREERWHEHLAETYVDTLRVLYRLHDAISSTEPDRGPIEPEEVPVPPREELEIANARLAAWGSDDIRDRVLALSQLQTEFYADVGLLRSLREHLKNFDAANRDLMPANLPQQVHEAFEAMRAKREEFYQRFRELQATMRRELAGSSRRWSWVRWPWSR